MPSTTSCNRMDLVYLKHERRTLSSLFAASDNQAFATVSLPNIHHYSLCKQCSRSATPLGSHHRLISLVKSSTQSSSDVLLWSACVYFQAKTSTQRHKRRRQPNTIMVMVLWHHKFIDSWKAKASTATCLKRSPH